MKDVKGLHGIIFNQLVPSVEVMTNMTQFRRDPWLLDVKLTLRYMDHIGRYKPSAGNDRVKDIFGHAHEAPCL